MKLLTYTHSSGLVGSTPGRISSVNFKTMDRKSSSSSSASATISPSFSSTSFSLVLISANTQKTRKKQKFLIYNKFVQKIGEFNLKDDDRERLKQLLSSLKGLTSKERIEEIYDQFGDILSHLSTKIGDKHQFIEKIVKFRNRFVHGNVQFRELDNEDLFWHFKNLQLILQLCILSKLDFSIEQIRELYYLDKIPAPHNA